MQILGLPVFIVTIKLTYLETKLQPKLEGVVLTISCVKIFSDVGDHALKGRRKFSRRQNEATLSSRTDLRVDWLSVFSPQPLRQ